jgi:hypothetical protein
MFRMRRFLLLLFLLLGVSVAWAADYQVVLKNSGKIIHGEFLAEDATTITLKINTAEVSFKKEKLDLARMKELNPPIATAAPGSPASGVVPGQRPRNEKGMASIHKLEAQIAEREQTLARYRAQPPSNDRDREISERVEELRLMRMALADLKLEYGTSEDPELVRLSRRADELFGPAEEAQRAYDNLPPNATKAEADAAWERFQEAEKRWQEAHEALTDAMKKSAEPK